MNLYLDKGYAFVTESAYKLNGKYETKTPKTASSRRRVALPLPLVSLPLDYKRSQSEMREGLGGHLTEEDFVF